VLIRGLRAWNCGELEKKGKKITCAGIGCEKKGACCGRFIVINNLKLSDNLESFRRNPHI
jgi:hypothetical protein